MNIALQSEAHEPLTGVVDGAGRPFLSPPALRLVHRRENAVGLVPCGSLALGNDRANRDIESRHPPERRRLRTKLRDTLARRCKRLGIDRVDIAQSRAHLEGAKRGAAEE